MSEPWFTKINKLEAELDEVKAHANETQTELEHMRTERDDYKARWDAMRETAIPADDVLKERDALRARCATYEKALEDIANHKMTSVDKVYLIQQCEGFQARAARALAPSGGGGE